MLRTFAEGVAFVTGGAYLRIEDWREAVEVNLMGAVHGVHAVWPRMLEQVLEALVRHEYAHMRVLPGRR